MKTMSFKLTRDTYERLVLVDHDRQTYQNVHPVRSFPLTAPQKGISLVGDEGQELAWISDLETLPEELVTLIRDELSKREFVPQIKSINHVSSFACPSNWEIDTDRGRTTLILKGEEYIRRLSDNALLISDAFGIEYMIRDISVLDRSSRKILDRFL